MSSSSAVYEVDKTIVKPALNKERHEDKLETSATSDIPITTTHTAIFFLTTPNLTAFTTPLFKLTATRFNRCAFLAPCFTAPDLNALAYSRLTLRLCKAFDKTLALASSGFLRKLRS
jgi:hypothetical protein